VEGASLLRLAREAIGYFIGGCAALRFVKSQPLPEVTILLKVAGDLVYAFFCNGD